MELAEEAKRCGTLFLLLTGGEPFLRDDFLLLYEKIARMGFRVVLNTNASLLNQDILDCFRYYHQDGLMYRFMVDAMRRMKSYVELLRKTRYWIPSES